MANVVISLRECRGQTELSVCVGYAPSRYNAPRTLAPIRSAGPISPEFAGWSTRPELPLAAVFGLGGEPGLALGAMQYLEPDKVWVFAPEGIDQRFDLALERANAHIEEIFDVTRFHYNIAAPVSVRARIDSLIQAMEGEFRVILVPFGPKIFGWICILGAMFQSHRRVGVWTFSSLEKERPVDRSAHGPIVWYNFSL